VGALVLSIRHQSHALIEFRHIVVPLVERCLVVFDRMDVDHQPRIKQPFDRAARVLFREPYAQQICKENLCPTCCSMFIVRGNPWRSTSLSGEFVVRLTWRTSSTKRADTSSASRVRSSPQCTTGTKMKKPRTMAGPWSSSLEYQLGSGGLPLRASTFPAQSSNSRRSRAQSRVTSRSLSHRSGTNTGAAHESTDWT